MKLKNLFEEEEEKKLGDLTIAGKKIAPRGVIRNVWDGNLDCRHKKITSLIGCPKEITGELACNYNDLTSLEGCAGKISGHFSCASNKLTSLIGCPGKIGKRF